MRPTSTPVRLSVKPKESILLCCLCTVVSRLSFCLSHTICPSPMDLACPCISILPHLEGICLYVCVCLCTCAALVHLIEAPCRHIGQIDQLLCQLSWQISPSVSLFLPTAPPSVFLSPRCSRSHFDSYTFTIKGQRRDGNVF